MQSAGKGAASADTVLYGRYVNCCQVGFSTAEFVMDFGQSDEDMAVEAYHTRIIASPLFIKQLLQTLADSMGKYERLHGPIAVHPAE